MELVGLGNTRILTDTAPEVHCFDDSNLHKCIDL